MTPAAGDAKPEMLLPPAPALSPWDWSGDGRILLYSAADPKTTKSHLWILLVDGERKPAPITQTEFIETQAQFSPDGRWISYTSNESGRNEIYVRPFPASPEQGGKIKVSEGGGTSARRHDGR
jgi:Tol biopolymer transport system component